MKQCRIKYIKLGLYKLEKKKYFDVRTTTEFFYLFSLNDYLLDGIWPGVGMLGDVGVEVDQDEVEVVGQPAHREKDDNQGKHPYYLRNNKYSE